MASDSALTDLQRRVLRELASSVPGWTLTGGGALALAYTRHRGTRDLDLFFHGPVRLKEVERSVADRMKVAGLRLDVVQRSPTFLRCTIGDGRDRVVVDLVSDPIPVVDEPGWFDLEGARVSVDSPHEILVNKVCALLSRTELRDLEDVGALLGAGGDLGRALADAPRKDAGFSAITLADVLRGWPIEETARLAGVPDAARRAADLRDRLVRQLLNLSKREAK